MPVEVLQSAAAIHVLCLGDLHLGRTPSKVSVSPEEVAHISPTAALERATDFAISSKLDAVVLTGDIIDQSNALFEAYAALSTQVKKLLKANIPVVAIAGNHDFEALPRLAEEVPEFHLLGSDGWEELLIPIQKKDALADSLRVQGISFRSKHWSGNPLESYKPFDDTTPTVALLHCDLDVRDSMYAPVALQELKTKAPHAWLLGHIHKPLQASQTPLVLYPGSPQGLDPGESGSHGATLISIHSLEDIQATAIPLAGLRYESLELDVSNCESIDAVRSLLLKRIRAWRAAQREEFPKGLKDFLQFVSLRLRLHGRCSLSHQTLRFLKQELLNSQGIEESGVRFLLDKILIETKPPLDLNQLLERDDPPSLLAARIRVLETQQPYENYQELLREAARRLEVLRQDPNYHQLEAAPPSEEDIREELLTSAWQLLDQLLQQGKSQSNPSLSLDSLPSGKQR